MLIGTGTTVGSNN